MSFNDNFETDELLLYPYGNDIEKDFTAVIFETAHEFTYCATSMDFRGGGYDSGLGSFGASPDFGQYDSATNSGHNSQGSSRNESSNHTPGYSAAAATAFGVTSLLSTMDIGNESGGLDSLDVSNTFGSDGCSNGGDGG